MRGFLALCPFVLAGYALANSWDDRRVVEPPPGFRVAYVGDQGFNDHSRAVLELIRDEKASLWVHLGDYDYQNNPEAWDGMINDVLGKSFPIFPVIGNHDLIAWDGYQKKISQRLAKIPGAECKGEIGVNMACQYHGMTFVLSGVGTRGEGHEEFLAEALNASTSPWKICAWHKNQGTMQVGAKLNETGWGVYETCRAYGAMIATGHEHSYSRTHLLSNFKKRTLVDDDDGQLLTLEPGKSFAFVSGLGGRDVRPQLRSGKHWAKIYTRTQGAVPGVLFCDYNVEGDARKALCFMKNIDGEIIDTYAIESKV